MKVIIVIEKYGGFCNRLFQSLHYHAYALEKDIKILNPSMLGLLKFDNNLFYFFDRINNFILKCLIKSLKLFFGKDEVCFYMNETNFIKFVTGWNYRQYKLTAKHHEVLKNIYSFDKRFLSRKSNSLKEFLINQKSKGKYIIGVHIRRGDYKEWNKGKYYFEDVFYKDIITSLREKLIKDSKKPYFVIVSNEKKMIDIEADYFSEGSWKDDQIILQSCDLIVGPPSTFSMWASYISKIPLIELNSNINKKLLNAKVCKG